MASRGVRSLRAVVAPLLVAPVLLLVAPGAAMACSCAEADVAQFVGYADTVAVGELA